MNYFFKFLESEKHLPYVISAYVLTFFIIGILKISSILKNRKLQKEFKEMINKNES